MAKSKNKLPPVQNRAEIIQRLTEHGAEIRAFTTTRLALFGSAARDELRKRSDVDVLVELSKVDSRNYFGLKFFLEDLMGRKIDLATDAAIKKPILRESVEKDLYDVIAA